MARKRIVTTAAGMVLPKHLLTRDGLSGAEHAARCQDKAQWFRDRGIDPGDWPSVYPILKASWRAHGLLSASERAQRRLRLKETT